MAGWATARSSATGLYVDNEVGGATSTGVGEEVMRNCGSFLVVELMRHGMRPTGRLQGSGRAYPEAQAGSQATSR